MPLVKTKLLPKKSMKLAQDLVNNPSHYQSTKGIETIDVIESFELGFHLGNVVKYALRADMKNEAPLEDLKKAAWYLARHLKHTQGKTLTITKDGKVTLS